jgi:hypothetical protein
MRPLSGIRKFPRLLQIVQRMPFREACRYLASRIPRELGLTTSAPKSVNPLFQSDDVRALTRKIELGTHAVGSYRPAPFDQRIVLVQASILELRRWTKITDRSGTNGWSAVCMGGVDVIKIDCKHNELLNEPYVSELAMRLDAALQARDRPAHGSHGSSRPHDAQENFLTHG